MIILKYGSTMQRDPWVKYYQGYYYYVCAKDGKELYIAKVKDLTLLQEAEFKCVYIAPEGKEYSKELWAPELHIINDKCYIYVACDDGLNDNHRMYVLENNSSDPLENYTMHGKITDSTDKWAIDGSVIEYKNQLYFVWSGWETDENIQQEIYIAKMSDPYTISSERVSISKPEKSWELNGGSPLVNEGPVGLIHGDDLFVTYSGSGCWTNFYCVGVLKLVGNNPLDKNSWIKLEQPLVSQNDKVKGPGHNSFTKIDGDDYIIYHAFDKDASFGERTVNVHLQKVYWKNGLPFVGEPE